MEANPKVDVYLENSAEFARPILTRIRAMVGQICPEAKEDFKWSFPFFTYKGGNLCHMAAFKKHCAFGFWFAPLMDDPAGIFVKRETQEAMGDLGKITEIRQLPTAEVLRPYLIQAMMLIEEGAKLPKAPKAKPEPLTIPDEFQKAMLEKPQVEFQFSKMTPGKQREYVQWIYSAKTDKTRQSRLETALDWIAEGKSMTWKYEKK